WLTPLYGGVKRFALPLHMPLVVNDEDIAFFGNVRGILRLVQDDIGYPVFLNGLGRRLRFRFLGLRLIVSGVGYASQTEYKEKKKYFSHAEKNSRRRQAWQSRVACRLYECLCYCGKPILC